MQPALERYQGTCMMQQHCCLVFWGETRTSLFVGTQWPVPCPHGNGTRKKMDGLLLGISVPSFLNYKYILMFLLLGSREITLMYFNISDFEKHNWNPGNMTDWTNKPCLDGIRPAQGGPGALRSSPCCLPWQQSVEAVPWQSGGHSWTAFWSSFQLDSMLFRCLHV